MLVGAEEEEEKDEAEWEEEEAEEEETGAVPGPDARPPASLLLAG